MSAEQTIPDDVRRTAADVFWDIAAQTPTTVPAGVPCWRVSVGREIIARAIAAERERCAKIAETVEQPQDGEYWIAARIAAAIRNGG